MNINKKGTHRGEDGERERTGREVRREKTDREKGKR